jgi:hypothetical protein
MGISLGNDCGKDTTYIPRFGNRHPRRVGVHCQEDTNPRELIARFRDPESTESIVSSKFRVYREFSIDMGSPPPVSARRTGAGLHKHTRPSPNP